MERLTSLQIRRQKTSPEQVGSNCNMGQQGAGQFPVKVACKNKDIITVAVYDESVCLYTSANKGNNTSSASDC